MNNLERGRVVTAVLGMGSWHFCSPPRPQQAIELRKARSKNLYAEAHLNLGSACSSGAETCIHALR